MLRPSLTHEQFQTFVLEQLKRHYFSKGEIIPILFNQQELAKVWVTDLSKLRPLIQKQYSHRGRPAKDPLSKDPLCLFRSLLLMHFIGETSIDKWVTKMRAFPLWAIYSGFSPDEVPGAATFYDFQRRLWLNERPYQTYKIRKARRKPKRGTKKGEKAPLQKPGIVQRLVGHFMKHPGDPSKYPYYLLQQILKSCFVLPSAQKGLLGDLENLSVSGDGTSVRTGASRYGKPTCECMKNRVYRCSCPRRFSDPDASWGWDS
ncbi:hypothetical protein J2S00_003945 [Caldalkalibacillus uzonensis]|uniref:Transposase InsH N-terminal domain-containing protein n=1 Tax=Caldalkalibacillus uzonensis TaxID=353224 RepID=A0ABU0CY72_9BACI|nr:hypothetical protein [Caldalkalibacillus uzonensis]MDQ0341101.1 hypothetical protein [Caldalkalibacillus uzonensis]